MSTPTPEVCPRTASHGQLVERPGTTREQRWSGTWLDCPDPLCGTTVLLMSDELRAQLATQACHVGLARRRYKTDGTRA